MLLTTHLKERFVTVRQQTTRICQPLQEEDYVVQPIADVSPPKWHLGHTTWFFETFLLSRQPGYTVFHPDYNYLFNSYYESIGARVIRTNRGNMTRPSVKEIFAYRTYVDRAMDELLDSEQADMPEMQALIELGLQHEQQHQELLLTDIQYILGNNPLFPAYVASVDNLPKFPTVRQAHDIAVSEGVYTVGFAGEDFCFDNERGRHRVYLHSYCISDRLVTNAEYMEFMEAGGYEHFEPWLQEGQNHR